MDDATASTRGSARCANHPSRAAVGVCVVCRMRICGECTTKVEGINHCVTCLATRAGPKMPESGRGQDRSPFISALWLALGMTAMTSLAWLTLELGARW